MSKEDLTAGGPVCRQRFKGIENFLKRVAFNLGNTPSQTEVKVISCIPIDVTDLQQKIIHLEKQLDDAKGIKGPTSTQPSKQSKIISPPKRTAVNTAFLHSNFPPVSTAAISCKSLDCDRSTSPTCLNSKKKSNVSFIFPDTSLNDDIPDSHENSYTSQGPEDNPNNILTFEHDDDILTEMCDPKPQEQRRNFFKKKKKFLKSKKGKSPCVYYAQTTSSPFTRSEVTGEDPQHDIDVMSRSYLAKMINKQYKPKLLGDNTSTISQFSSPICRDIQPRCEGSRKCRYDSDICSCCHGPYHNIDNHMGKFNNPQTYMINEMNTGSAYYDINHYDLVPVKEKPVKIKKDDRDMPRKKEPKPHFDMKCWPENVRTRQHRYYAYPAVSTRQRTDCHYRDRLDNYVKKLPIKHRIEPMPKKVVKRRKEIYKRERPISIATSKSCSVDLGTIYPKRVLKKPRKQESLAPIAVPRKNAECLTTVINNSECQTVTSNVEANSTDAKTEATLNQIKSILQSVLEEVKVSSQVKSHVSVEKPKKDAVVQKGPSQSNMQASSLMNSITYSPYAINPSPFMASCSRQLNPSQFYYPQSALKCFQNFPLFIQGPGRHVCASCYRNSSHAKSGYMRQAATIATNTENVTEERSKETEKLIKEIYKSMALTLDMPNKDTSLSEYEDLMKSVHGFTSPIYIKAEPKKQPKKIRTVVQAVSELFMKKDIVDTSEAPKSTIEQQSKLTSNDTSTQSQLVTTDTDVKVRKERLEQYLRMRNKESEEAEAEKRTYRESLIHNTTTITETETSSSEAESSTTLVLQKEAIEPKQKKEKQGLFTKMFKSVKLFKPKDKTRIKDVITESEEESSSDSDDYQTVYSQKIDKSVKHKQRALNMPKHKTHSKISYKQTYHQRDKSPEKRKSPYMEQEYRRYWNEKLMFHDNNAPRHSSEQVYSEQSTPQKSAYYQTYEARSAFVEPTKMHNHKDERRTGRINRDDDNETKTESKPSKGMAWLKKHKMGIHCGEQWKKLILEG